MDREECNCDEQEIGKTCPMCTAEVALPYWCEMCERLVAEKRCPGCGLKAKKVRRPPPK